jgi:hypothetical protein
MSIECNFENRKFYAVITEPNEDFRRHSHVKVSHSVTMCHIYFISQLAFLNNFSFLKLFVVIVSHCATV